MKFKIDENFEKVLRAARKWSDYADESIELADRFTREGIIKDDRELSGKTFGELTRNEQVSRVLGVLLRYLNVENIKPEVWDALCSCVLLDDMLCPYCGKGELEYEDSDMNQYKGDRDTPSYAEPINWKYYCDECGETCVISYEL